jgi:hypothetical protein
MGSFRSFSGVESLMISTRDRRKKMGRYYWDKKDTVEDYYPTILT